MATVNPFTLDYQQFLAAMQPYASADGSAYKWNSPEGQNGSVALKLANGKTWTPSGAGSGVEFIPKGTLLNPLNEGAKNYDMQKMNWVPKYATEDTYKISGDMSALLGQNDTNAHKTIDYVLQNGQLVPKSTADWQYQTGGFLGGVGKALSDAAKDPFVQAVGLGMFGLNAAGVGSAAAGGAQAAANAGLAYSNGLTAADVAAMGGAAASPVAAGAVEASMLPSLGGLEAASGAQAAADAGLAYGGTEAAAGGGLLSGIGAGSTAPMGFGTAAATDAQLAAAVGTGTGASGGLLSGIGGALNSGVGAINDALGTNLTAGGVLSGGANLLGGYLNQKSATDAAQTQADAQIRAAQIAADAAKFRPVGVSTRFGSSQFGFDPNTGYLTSAGYTLSPEMKAQQDALMNTSNGMLTQFQGSQAATAPMGDAAARMMSLGNQYLATDPQAQAQKYMADQQALLSAGRNTDMAKLQEQMQAQGRGGFAIGGGDGMFASNPQMQALLNAQRQQDLGLAAQATQGGMDYAKFGSGMVGSGGDMLKGMYGTQSAAFTPYQTALGGAQTIEGLGQNALDQGINLGKTSTTANANAGQLLGQGYNNAAQTIGITAQQVGSPWGNLLSGVAQGSQQYRFDPFTGKAL
jgi:hypothetical protein